MTSLSQSYSLAILSLPSHSKLINNQRRHNIKTLTDCRKPDNLLNIRSRISSLSNNVHWLFHHFLSVLIHYSMSIRLWSWYYFHAITLLGWDISFTITLSICQLTNLPFYFWAFLFRDRWIIKPSIEYIISSPIRVFQVLPQMKLWNYA